MQLTRTADVTGLSRALSAALTPWRKPLASHDPGRNRLRRPTSGVSGSTCCACLSITARPGPGNPCPSCCARVTPAPTPPPTTKKPSTKRWRRSPASTSAGAGSARRCWSAPTPQAEPMSSSTTCTPGGWRTRSGSGGACPAPRLGLVRLPYFQSMTAASLRSVMGRASSCSSQMRWRLASVSSRPGPRRLPGVKVAGRWRMPWMTPMVS